MLDSSRIGWEDAMSTALSKKLQSAFSSNLSPSLLAGFITAIVGIAAFGIIHAYIIEPIWRSLPGGIPFGLIGGAAMGWAFYELHASGKVSLTVRGGAVFGLSLWL